MIISDKLANRVLSVEPSVTLGLSSKAKQLASSDHNVIGFAAGELDFQPPEHVKTAAIEAIKQGQTRYTPSSGTLRLRKAISKKLLKQNNLSYAEDQIIVTTGAKYAVFVSLMATINPGDEVILFAPYWLSYPQMIKLLDGKVKVVEPEDKKFPIPSIERIKAAISLKTKAIILNNPCNPTGHIWPEAMVREVAKLCVERNIFLISDEIYEQLVLDENKKVISPASFGEEFKKRVIVINGLSKSFAITGWRIGYAASDTELISRMKMCLDHTTSCPSSISQEAAYAALEGPNGFTRMVVKHLKARREIITKYLDNLGIEYVYPNSAFYLFADITTLGLSGFEFSNQLLEQKNILVVPGEPFGWNGYLRFSFALSDEKINEGMGCFTRFVKSLA